MRGSQGHRSKYDSIAKVKAQSANTDLPSSLVPPISRTCFCDNYFTCDAPDSPQSRNKILERKKKKSFVLCMFVDASCGCFNICLPQVNCFEVALWFWACA